MKKQDSVPVGCVRTTCQLYVFWWLPLGTGGLGPQVSKFEQVSSEPPDVSNRLMEGSHVWYRGSEYHVPMHHG